MRDTIDMAREAGFNFDGMPYTVRGNHAQLAHLEALVRADEREALQAEVLEQCRINGMSAEREDALRAELTRLKASIALDWMANNARDLGLDYEPAVQERNFCERCGKRLGGDGHIHTCTPPAAQPAPVQDLPFGVGGGLVAIKTLLGRDPCVHANTAIEMIDAILKEHPAAQKPWVGLTDDELVAAIYELEGFAFGLDNGNVSDKIVVEYARLVEAKLKEKNHV
jgi:hypothetical protein